MADIQVTLKLQINIEYKSFKKHAVFVFIFAFFQEKIRTYHVNHNTDISLLSVTYTNFQITKSLYSEAKKLGGACAVSTTNNIQSPYNWKSTNPQKTTQCQSLHFSTNPTFKNSLKNPLLNK